MSYKYNDDDVIVFDLFDDEQYKNWQAKVRQNAGGDKSEETVKENVDTDFDDEPDYTDVEELSLDDILKKLDSNLEKTTISESDEGSENNEAEAEKLPEKTKTNKSPEEKTSETKRSKNDILKAVVEILAYVAVAVLIITMVPRYVMERVSVDGSSMNNTLQDGDQLIGDRLTVRLNRLKRFDIIYFNPQGNKSIEPYIKRIIGLPGDTVRIEDSVIYINGMPLQEDYAAEPKFKAYSASETIWLGEDEYFVLGDNRNNSTDSRFSSVGVVNRADIEGKAVFRLWPLSSFGKID